LANVTASSAARSGLLTGISTAVVTGLAAVVGIVIAREFGRSAETDGFFAAYGIFIVIVLVATALRAVVMPRLALARQEGRLAAEASADALALSVLAVPALLLSTFAADRLADLLTASPEAQHVAADALVWIVPAAVAQLYAALAASTLAAFDDYGSAALGYALGSVSGLALILLRVDADGIVALAWGMALNGAVALAVPAVALVMHARPGRSRAGRIDLGLRLWEFARGAALPFALQGLYVICLRFAAELGEGDATSFSYAYLAAAAFVAVTASSLALGSTVPLTRAGLDAERTARHVVSASWLALVVVAGAAGVFAVAGRPLVEAALGDTYGGDVGAEVGHLVVYLSPFMAASIGISVAFPLLFVARRTRGLVPLAVAALAVHVPIAWAGKELLGLAGVAAALGATSLLVLAALLALLSPAAFGRVATGLAAASGVAGGLALVAFGPLAPLLDPLLAGAVGLALYGGALAALRPRGLREAWSYVHALR
jgi:hypothetical protein